MLKLGVLFPIYLLNLALSSVCLGILRHWQGSEFEVKIITPSAEPECRDPIVREVIPPGLLHYLIYRLPFSPPGYPNLSTYLAEQLFLRQLNQFDLTYFWPGHSLSSMQKVKTAGKPVILERVNCTLGQTRDILDAAYTSLGVAPPHGITDAAIAEHNEVAKLADYLFCPSPLVAESCRAIGVPADKILMTSEGWSPELYPHCLQPQPDPPPEEKPLIVLFVGSINVRKGVHLLLRAWEQADINGQLWLVGDIEPTIATVCQAQLNRPDVVHYAYTRDLGSLYSAADMFAIASYEEGSPLVTYIALAHGLPILATPMGGGGVVRDGRDGFILPTDHVESWVTALRKLAADRDLRHHLSTSARQEGQKYTWDKVALRRAQTLKAKIS